MRLLHLYWPHLPLRLARSRPAPPGSGTLPDATAAEVASGSFPEGPVVLGGQPWTDGTVLDADPIAWSLGVRRGMPLGSAHRLAPEATFLDPDPGADRAVVEAAFERLAAFSPGLAGASDPYDPAFGLLEVQVDGLGPLWGEDPVLVRRLVDALASILPGPPRAGIAGTRFAATVAASRAPGPGPVVVPEGGEQAFLAPLPSGLLSRDPDIRARLSRFGLRWIGQVAALPRSALLARFGETGGRIHARARGEETDPFRPRRAPGRLLLGLPIDPAVADLEPLRFVLRRLAGALAGQLTARGAAADRVSVRLVLDAGLVRGAPPRLERLQRFPEPTADAEAIERLVLARLEREPPPAPVERLELELLGVGPAVGQQLSLFVPQAARDARLGWQLARLALAYGEDRLLRAELLDPDAPLPERRARWCPAAPGLPQDAVTTGGDR
jgi:nucleotidyltransferase/DNA polymerase involved in DNA repair